MSQMLPPRSHYPAQERAVKSKLFAYERNARIITRNPNNKCMLFDCQAKSSGFGKLIQ